MSMLAEPRRKVKYSVNPRGLDWVNDDTKIGQKLMEKMGWSKGKGLGAKEDGKREHIRVSMKNDNKGVGCTKRESDNWFAHKDDYAELLAQLNEAHNASGNLSVDSDSSAVVCAVAKKPIYSKISKNSMRREHYQKLAKIKDLSLGAAQDLNGGQDGEASDTAREDIQKIVDEPAPEVPVTDQSEMTKNKVTGDKAENEFGVKTVTSSTSISDYFAKMMALRRAKSSSSLFTTDPSDVVPPSTSAVEEPMTLNKTDSSSGEGITFSVETSKRKRKRKRDVESSDESSERGKKAKVDEEEMNSRKGFATEKVEECVEVSEGGKKCRASRREMKRARKLKESDDLEQTGDCIKTNDRNVSASNTVECNEIITCEDVLVSEKKKKKRKAGKVSEVVLVSDMMNQSGMSIEIKDENVITVNESECIEINTAPVMGADDGEKKKKRKAAKVSNVEHEAVANQVGSKEVICLDDDEDKDSVVVVAKINNKNKNKTIGDVLAISVSETMKSGKNVKKRNTSDERSSFEVSPVDRPRNGKGDGAEDISDVLEIICVDDEDVAAVVGQKKAKKNKKNIHNVQVGQWDTEKAVQRKSTKNLEVGEEVVTIVEQGKKPPKVSVSTGNSSVEPIVIVTAKKSKKKK